MSPAYRLGLLTGLGLRKKAAPDPDLVKGILQAIADIEKRKKFKPKADQFSH